MLILGRRPGDRIVISGGIIITIIDLSRGSNSVRVGIEAPPNVAVDREEVAIRRKQDQDTQEHSK